jgi:metal-responsive CopG/Arc/MetJ family transcriptional regulator
MTKVSESEYDRITFSLPKSMNEALDALKEETKRSKSELIKLAIENYLAKREELKLQKAVEMMRKEYERDEELTAFTSLDSEDFL